MADSRFRPIRLIGDEPMKYQRFEDLPVWRAGLDLAAAVYALTERPAFRRRYSLRDQIERAAVSISK